MNILVVNMTVFTSISEQLGFNSAFFRKELIMCSACLLIGVHPTYSQPLLSFYL